MNKKIILCFFLITIMLFTVACGSRPSPNPCDSPLTYSKEKCCGDGICNAGETNEDCSADCPIFS